MRDSDALENNPKISVSALEAIHSQVYGWALSRCAYDKSVAEDLMQQAYMEMVSGNAMFEGRSTLKTFVFSVIQNLARSRYRRLATRLRLLTIYGKEDEVASEEPVVAETGIWTVVGALPARQRDVLELVFIRDLTIEQASEVMGVSVGTARVHYDRAKKALRQKLEDDHG